jgi:hypothetical protein
MTPEIKAAIESARTAAIDRPRLFHLATPQRKHSFEFIRALLLAVVRELPEDMRVAELRDELEIGNNQGSGQK